MLGTDGSTQLIPLKGYKARVDQERVGLFPRFSRAPALGLIVYQVLLTSTAVLLLGAAVWSGWGIGNLWAVAGLAVVAGVAERGRVPIAGVTEASISLLPTVFAAAVFGPVAAMMIAAASFLGELPVLMTAARRASAFERGRPYLKWGVYTASRSITGGAAGFTASTTAYFASQPVPRVIIGTAIAALVAETLDMAFAAMTLRLRGGRAGEFVRMIASVVLGYASIYAPVIAILAVAYLKLSPLTLPLFFVPALAAQRLFGLYQQQRTLAEDLGLANERLEAANLSFASALVATLDARDRYTAGHSAAVAIYARDIACRLGLSAREQQLVHLAGLVHDIGKIGLPAGLLEKPGALTLDERRHMEEHSVIGERILANVDTYSEIASIVRHHHERIDGAGYPDGLPGSRIPLLSRIIAVADAYNAMTSDRPYRDAMPSRVARLRLAQAVDSQFDTSVVAAFEAVLTSAGESYRLAQHPEFRFLTHDPLLNEGKLDRPVIEQLAQVS
jgi:putative nucleotidyltransferase with HDIG domain